MPIFGFPEANAGMTITGGASKLLPMIVGLNKARELVLTGEFIDAAEGHRIGLVNKLVPLGEEEKRKLNGWRGLSCRVRTACRDATQAHAAAINRGGLRDGAQSGETDHHDT